MALQPTLGPLMCWFFHQNTNGVNFYNILTQQPDEKRVSSLGENFMGEEAEEQLSGFLQ